MLWPPGKLFVLKGSESIVLSNKVGLKKIDSDPFTHEFLKIPPVSRGNHTNFKIRKADISHCNAT